MEVNVLTERIIGCAMRVHSKLGPGLLESIYRRALEHELRELGLNVVSEKPISMIYDGIDLGTGLRLDLLVEDAVIVETKSVRRIHEIDESQILSHLQFCGCRIGLLTNFNVRHLRDGIRRFVR